MKNQSSQMTKANPGPPLIPSHSLLVLTSQLMSVREMNPLGILRALRGKSKKQNKMQFCYSGRIALSFPKRHYQSFESLNQAGTSSAH